MSDKRIIFMGTPEFACGILQTLIDLKTNVVGVVCQPDKLVGRKQVLTACAVKQLSLQYNIPVIQPIKIRNDYQEIIDLKPDLIITCAYGQIIPQIILDTPKLGCINVHGSLLPYLRGGAPIQHSIIDGYKTTGITIMEMSAKMDAGDIITQKSVDILDTDTYKTLHDKLKDCAISLLKETLPSLLDHSYTHTKQDESLVTFGYNISKEEEHVDFTKSYDQVYNLMRGLIDNPCSYIIVDDKKVKIYQVEKSLETLNQENGYLTYVDNKLGIVVDNRLILVSQLQLEGKNKMSVKEFKNGAGRNWQGKVAK